MSDLRDTLIEALRPAIDDEALTRTGRSLGDLASGHIAAAGVDAIYGLVEAAVSRARQEGRAEAESAAYAAYLQGRQEVMAAWNAAADPSGEFAASLASAAKCQECGDVITPCDEMLCGPCIDKRFGEAG